MFEEKIEVYPAIQTIVKKQDRKIHRHGWFFFCPDLQREMFVCPFNTKNKFLSTTKKVERQLLKLDIGDDGDNSIYSMWEMASILIAKKINEVIEEKDGTDYCFLHAALDSNELFVTDEQGYEYPLVEYIEFEADDGPAVKIRDLLNSLTIPKE